MNGQYNNNKRNDRFCRLALWAICAIVSMMVGHASADDYVVAEGNRSLMVALGCFWCAEQAFEQYAPGVVEAVSGYAGGINDNPSELFIYLSLFLVGFGFGWLVAFSDAKLTLSYWHNLFPHESLFSTNPFQTQPTETTPATTR
jgi:hypothetical protein